MANYDKLQQEFEKKKLACIASLAKELYGKSASGKEYPSSMTFQTPFGYIRIEKTSFNLKDHVIYP